jgi:predicted PurR-regulated permease PerM
MAVVMIARLLWLVGDILILILIAAILATSLNPLVESLQRRRWTRRSWALSRTASIAVVYVGLLVGIGIATDVLLSPIVSESSEFIQRAPELMRQLETRLVELQTRYTWLPDLAALLRRLPQEAGRLTDYLDEATGVAFKVFGGLVSAITTLILSIYMLVEGPAIKRGFLSLFPPDRHKRLEMVLEHVGQKFGGWLRGQLLLGVIIGVIAGIGTWALGLPYPFLLGLAAGITELIPLVGPVLGAIPAVLVALFGPTWRLFAVIGYFTLIQQLEGNLLVPRVMARTVGLSPLLTIVAIMIGTRLMGILGALLAVPIAAALQVIVVEVLHTFRSEA